MFSFVEDISDAAISAAGRDIKEYGALSRRWNGKLNSAVPLVMAFSQKAADFDQLSDYQTFGWNTLQDLHLRDPSPWPENVARQVHSPFWSFCHSDMQLFVNMSIPAHEKRLSRNLGQHFLFIINPRERFDIVAGDTPEGNKVRAQIRRRCQAYDGHPHAPVLGSYEKGELEWIQYALPEENGAPPMACPFHVKADD